MAALKPASGVRPAQQQNLLLACLPRETLNRWSPDLQNVAVSLGDVLFEAGASIEYAYFPETALVSLLSVMSNGASTEIAVVGNDGIVGVSLFMGGGPVTFRAVVQSAGTAARIPAAALVEEFARGGTVSQLMLRYTQALLAQMTQTAACNRHHTIEQQLCRWLLVSLDRIPAEELVMTQELIANMLGVRREGVTAAAMRLQRAGLISYSRGRIRVIDRRALEAHTCECYAVVQREYTRLLPWVRQGAGARAARAAG